MLVGKFRAKGRSLVSVLLGMSRQSRYTQHDLAQVFVLEKIDCLELVEFGDADHLERHKERVDVFHLFEGHFGACRLDVAVLDYLVCQSG